MQPDVTSRAPEPESIGERLLRLRRERGLSQRMLAGEGISASYISRVESGTRRPSVRALRLIAPKLGVSATYLETGSDLAQEEERKLRLYDAELELRLAPDPSQAEQALLAVLEEATAAHDEESAWRARVGLGLVAAHRGAYAEAIAKLEPAAEAGGLRPALHPDVFAALGRSYVGRGEHERAVALFERCLSELDGADDPAASIRFATYLSYALADLGQLERARRVLGDVLERVGDVADPYSRVRLYWSQARLAADEGRMRLALATMQRAIALLEASEDTMHLARAHLLCAEILFSEGRLDEEGQHLERAEALLGEHAPAQDRAWLLSEQAKREARLGRAAGALAHAREALALLGDDDPAEQGRAHWALAEALVVEGGVDAADAAFRRADELLRSEGRYTAQLYRAWAHALRAAGRDEEALRLLDLAVKAAGGRMRPAARRAVAGVAADSSRHELGEAG